MFLLVEFLFKYLFINISTFCNKKKSYLKKQTEYEIN